MSNIGEKFLVVLCNNIFLSNLQSYKLDFCEHYKFGKYHMSIFDVRTHNSKAIFDYVHSDVWGSSSTFSHSKKFYYVIFIDDYSMFVRIYFLHNKSDIFVTFKKYKTQVENETCTMMRCLQSDNNEKYISREFERYWEE